MLDQSLSSSVGGGSVEVAIILLAAILFVIGISSLVKIFRRSPNHNEPQRVIIDEGWPGFFSAVQALITAAALIVAGVWFFLEREWAPRLYIEQTVSHRQLDDDWHWVRVTVEIENRGNRLLRLTEGATTIHKVLPLPRVIQERISRRQHILRKDQMMVDFPTLGEALDLDLEGEIEPGEVESIYAEFMVPTNIETIIANTIVRKSSEEELWYRKSDLYDFD